MNKLIWHGHSCFKVLDEEKSLLFDPYQKDSVPGLTLPDNIEVDEIFISHNHHDHNAKELIKERNKYHFDVIYLDIPHDKENGSRRGMNKSPIVKFNNLRIAHLGDIGTSLNQEQIDLLKGVDVLLCPINGFYTIGAKEALEIFKLIRPKIFIPMHYEYSGKGYPDGGQINIFKSLSGGYISIKEKEIVIDDYLNGNNIIVLDDKE